jgi:hypothetical protein
LVDLVESALGLAVELFLSFYGTSCELQILISKSEIRNKLK